MRCKLPSIAAIRCLRESPWSLGSSLMAYMALVVRTRLSRGTIDNSVDATTRSFSPVEYQLAMS